MIYIGTDQGIYRWFHGAPWPIFHSLQEQSVIGIAGAAGGVLAALDTDGNVWESMTNGMEWRRLSRPSGAGRPTALGLANGAAPALLLATAGPLGLFRRPVGTAEPMEKAAPPPLAAARRVISYALGTHQGGTATRTRASGRKRPVAVWSPVATPSVELAGSLNGARLLLTGEGQQPWLAAVVGSGLWSGAGTDVTWTRCAGLPDEVYAVRRAGETLVAGTSQGVWISADGGKSWAAKSDGLGDHQTVTAVDLKPGDPRVLLAGASVAGVNGAVTRTALFESKDGGAAWKHVTRGFPVDLETDRIVDIRHDPANTDFALVALASGELWKTFTDGFWWEPLARQIHRARVLHVTS